EQDLLATQKPEAFWRRALADMQTLPLPLGAADAAEGVLAEVELPASCTPEALAASTLAWLLRSTGEASGSIALSLPNLESAAR
ncbi:hypothetical protein SB748_35315, partial [Rhizobium sp. SIMBA_035]